MTATEQKPYFNLLEEKPKLILSHDLGAGASCLNCDCPGLDLHFWRKRCKICTCRADEHNIELPPDHDYCNIINRRNINPGKIQIEEEKFSAVNGRIREKKDKGNVNSTERVKLLKEKLEWIPSEDVVLAEKYLAALNEKDRPIKGTEGGQKRRQRLQYQLPVYDCYPESAVSVESPAIRQELEKFVKKAQDNVAMGQVVCSNVNSLQEKGYQGQIITTPHGKVASCHRCNQVIPPDSVGILPSNKHSVLEDIWHPACFKCEECNDLLADLLYFHKDGKYLCGRHYCEKTYDRCAGCDELILDKQYTRAEDRSWHVKHFCCFGCDKSFINEDYVNKNEMFYCLDCYLIKFAKICFGCGQKIAAPEAFVVHKELYWHKHPKCFRCRKCAKYLETKFLFKNNNIFCSDLCKREFEKIA
ncbi:unnamed protein product [Bursaphelenchus xylophilus]|uniref:(pine wood nematode) hypothetical protein n=1 Tax=Bursaphelenchus xylophilus TaxID=6326 RepID=A0A1I7S320_BURXY|nr:unnamed protein product [Bursaphelenchus xylophilus]CAG9116067.1 unnamed protein product [Bursaphelenchus xylophilus]